MLGWGGRRAGSVQVLQTEAKNSNILYITLSTVKIGVRVGPVQVAKINFVIITFTTALKIMIHGLQMHVLLPLVFISRWYSGFPRSQKSKN